MASLTVIKFFVTVILGLQCGFADGAPRQRYNYITPPLHTDIPKDAGHKRFLLQRPEVEPIPLLISEGLDGFDSRRPMMLVRDVISVKSNSSGESYCEQTYGVLPCTKTVYGNLFLLVVYGFLMFKAASFLSDGSELLLRVMGPGIIGGLVLPILGALPDTLLIFVSGISGSKETAQQQVAIGMGLLAGSTVMLMTALWGACLVVGKCDLSLESVAIDSKDTKGFSLFGSGVTVDKSTRKASWIMMATIVPFIIAQIPLIFNLKSGKHASVLVACIVALLSLLGYCLFQIFEPWVQKRRLAFLKHRHIISSILAEHQKRFGALVKANGEPNEAVIHKVFKRLDEDNDQYLSKGELHGLLVGLNIDQEIDIVDKIMFEFDVEPDNRLTQLEFKNGMSKWIYMATSTVGHSNQDSIATDFHKKIEDELEALMDKDEISTVENKWKVYMKACLLLLGGAVIAGVFADPLIDVVNNFSDATNIPSFFISFIAMPLATNSSEAISALIFASRKRKRTASLTYSEIYGAVTMNNTLCLGVFLAIVYIRGLDWNFSAEVLVILVVIIVMGIIGSICTTLKLWMCAIACLLYPLSLVMVYVLDYILGWT